MRMTSASVFFVYLLVFPALAAASPLGIAGDYNVFVKENIDLKRTDAWGGVAAGGDVTLEKVSVARKINAAPGVSTPYPVPPGLPTGDLVAGGSLDFNSGSVGYFADENSGDPAYKKGSIVVGNTATFGQTNGGVNVGYGELREGEQTIDFQASWDHLANVSGLWSTLPTNGTTNGLYDPLGALYEVKLRGSDPVLNVFDLGGLANNSTVDLRNLGFYLDVPATATILINVPGETAFFESFGFYFWDSTWDPALSNTDQGEPMPYIRGDRDTAGLFPDSRILYNFFEADALSMAFIEMHGSVLAPWADVLFYEGHIEGNLIAKSLLGPANDDLHWLWDSDANGYAYRPYNGGEAHNELFEGNLPVPEPATSILIALGLLAVFLQRRRLSANAR